MSLGPADLDWPVETGRLSIRPATAADAEATWRLMQRVGMRREEYSRADSLHRSGVRLGGMACALLADEWRPGRDGAAARAQ